MLKRKIAMAMSICILSCSIITGCSGGKELPNVQETATEVEVEKDDSADATVSKETEIVENETKNKKVTEIGKDILGLLGDKKEAVVDAVTGSAKGIKIKKTKNGISVTTELQSQRDAAVETLSGFIAETAGELQSGSDSLKFNYDMQNGYIDIFCKEEDSEKVQDAVNSVVGIAALARRMCDNSTNWNISVMVSDSDTGMMVEKTVLSEEESSFSLTKDAWKPVDNGKKDE